MRWNESETAGKLYKHYFVRLISSGRVVIETAKADSLGHTLRGVLKGFKKRGEVPYSSLYGNVIIRVQDNAVVLEKKVATLGGVEQLSPTGREYVIHAASTVNDVLKAIGYLIDNRIDQLAFLQVTDLNEMNKATIAALCREHNFTFNMSDQQCVVMR